MRSGDRLGAVRDGLIGGIEYFSVDIKLELTGGGIADTNRSGVLESGEPLDFPFSYPALTSESVDNLNICRIARHRSQKPLAPGVRLITVTGVQH